MTACTVQDTMCKLQMENCDWLLENLKDDKRFEDLELGGDLHDGGIPVYIGKKLEDLVELTEKAHKFTLK